MFVRMLAVAALSVVPLVASSATVEYDTGTNTLTLEMGVPTIARTGVDPGAFDFSSYAGQMVTASIQFGDTSILGVRTGGRRNYVDSAATITFIPETGPSFEFAANGGPAGVNVQVRNEGLRIFTAGASSSAGTEDMRSNRAFRWSWQGLNSRTIQTLDELLAGLNANTGQIDGTSANPRVNSYSDRESGGLRRTTTLQFDETPAPPVVPLPAGGTLLVTGLVAAVALRRRRRAA